MTLKAIINSIILLQKSKLRIILLKTFISKNLRLKKYSQPISKWQSPQNKVKKLKKEILRKKRIEKSNFIIYHEFLKSFF